MAAFYRLSCYVLLLVGLSRWGMADGTQAARFLSNEGTVIYLLAGTTLPLVTDHQQGTTDSLRTADALATSMLLAQGLKSTIHETRPDGSSDDSFPSGHTTAAFAVATAASHFHPRQAPFWYGGAVLIAASRVQLDRHYTQDVLAGAAIGYLTTRWALAHPHGVLLAPIIDHTTGTHGVQLVTRF